VSGNEELLEVEVIGDELNNLPLKKVMQDEEERIDIEEIRTNSIETIKNELNANL